MAMNIGEVAALAGIPTATVRYYERRGLIAEAPRTEAGYRQYGAETARRLRFIKRAQRMGFTLDEIQDLLGLRVDDPAACPVVEGKTREKIAQVERRIRELTRIQEVLEGLADSCGALVPTAECPILEALSEEEVDA
jgi:Hg(II)-responsive transcriptional regulator